MQDSVWLFQGAKVQTLQGHLQPLTCFEVTYLSNIRFYLAKNLTSL